MNQDKDEIASVEPSEAQAVDRIQEPVVRPLKLVSMTQTCWGCPSQWDAMTDDGRQVYIRYRWGCLSVRVGKPGDMTEYAGVRGEPFIDEQHGDGLDGIMSTETLIRVCGSRVEWPNAEGQHHE